MFVKKRFIFILILTLAPALAGAQMFSVTDQQNRPEISNTFVRIGTSFTDFAFQGSLSSEPTAELLEISQPVLVFGIESSGLQANAIIGNKITGIKDGSFFDLNLKFSNNIAIVRRTKVQAGIPIQLSTGITTSNNDFNEDRFNQTIFAGGTGAFMNLNLSQKVRFNIDGVLGYGFSNSNGGFFGGNLFYLNGRARLLINDFLLNRGVSFGYDYSFKSFDIDVETYDYDLTAHFLTIGISL